MCLNNFTKKRIKLIIYFYLYQILFFVFFVTAHTFNRYDHATGWFETLKIVPSHYETF